MSVLRRQESVRRMIQIGIVPLCSRMSYQTLRALCGIFVCVVAMTSIVGVFKSAAGLHYREIRSAWTRNQCE